MIPVEKKFLRIDGRREATFIPQNEHALAALGNPVLACIQNAHGLDHIVPHSFGPPHEGCQHFPGMANGQTSDVLHDEVVGVQFGDERDEPEDELVAFVLRIPFADKGKTLAGRTAKNDRNRLVADPRSASDFGSGHPRQVAANGLAFREIKRVIFDVDRVGIDRRGHLESGPFETEGHSPDAAEELNGYGSSGCHAASCRNRTTF